jgi:hypothetical protein
MVTWRLVCPVSSLLPWRKSEIGQRRQSCPVCCPDLEEISVASTKDWFEAMAAKDIEAVMATVHEDVLMIQNEQVLDRSDLQTGWLKSMSGDDWIMSD